MPQKGRFGDDDIDYLIDYHSTVVLQLDWKHKELVSASWNNGSKISLSPSHCCKKSQLSYPRNRPWRLTGMFPVTYDHLHMKSKAISVTGGEGLQVCFLYRKIIYL
jgi:hypothetical protein